jgi:hypothetical protein
METNTRLNHKLTMSDPEDTSSHSSTTVVEIPHEDSFCEHRRQQNREAQRRFRSQFYVCPATTVHYT